MTELRLTELSFERVEFRVGDRYVSVRVGSGNDWLGACLYPHVFDATGEATGDPVLDHHIRIRASEELVRLVAATGRVRGRIAA